MARRRPLLALALALALARLAPEAGAQAATEPVRQGLDDAAFFDAYLAAKRESPRAPVKALVESVFWTHEENAAPRSLTEPDQAGEALLGYAESLYANGQYPLAGQTLAQLADSDRRRYATRVATLQTQLALRGSGAVPPMVGADRDGRLALNQALAALAAGRKDAEGRKTAIAQLRKLAAQDGAAPAARHRALLWIALLQSQQGQPAEAVQTLSGIGAGTPLAIDTMLVWLHTQPTVSPLAAAAIERHIADQLPASAAAWEAREGLFSSLLAAGAIAQAGEEALEGVSAGKEQIERLDHLLGRLGQASLAEVLSAVQFLPEENRKRVATLLERREKLAVERRLNTWLPYMFSYRGRLQNDPDKFFAGIRELVGSTRNGLQRGDGTPKERLGMLRFDIAQVTGTPPDKSAAYRLFAGVAKWELSAAYPADWNPEQNPASQRTALEHSSQLLDLFALRYRPTQAAAGESIEPRVKSVSERNNALMNEIRSLAPKIERALRDEIMLGLHQRRQLAQEWTLRFAFHALSAFARHAPEQPQIRFDIEKPATLDHDDAIVPQLQKLGGAGRVEKARQLELAPAVAALQLVIDGGEDRPLRAAAMRLQAQTIVALGEARQPANASEAAALYQALLKDYADLIDRAETSYQLARAQELAKRPAEQLATLSAFVSTYPGDPRAHEAAFRIGEIHFAAGDYAKARSAYGAMIALGETRYREQAQYKLGWTYYKLGEFRDALPHFIAVADRADDKSGAAGPGADRLRKDRVKDSFRAIVLTFSNLSGEGEIERYFNQPGRRQHLHDIYASVASLHLERDRIQDAANGYAALVRQYPNHPRGPELLAGIVRGAQRMGLNRLALSEQESFVERYATTGAYWKQASADTRAQIGSELKPFLAELAALYHADAQQQKSGSSRDKAIRYYSAYIDGFPDDTELPRLLFLRGEAYADAGELNPALADYDRAAGSTHATAAEASYAALVTSEKLIAQGKSADERRARLRELVARSSRFAGSFAGDPRVDEVLAKAGEDILLLGEPAEAVTLGDNLLARQPGGAIRRRAQVMLAHGLFETGAFARAEAAYEQALTTGGHSAEVGQALRERYGLAVYRQAEAQRAAGNATLATSNFLRVGRLVPGSEIVANAEIDAAALMIESKRWNEAIDLLERFSRERPKHALAATVPVRLAVAYENTGRYLRAAEMLETQSLAETQQAAGGDRALAAQQQLRAAELRDKDGKRELAVATLERYLGRFPEPLEAAVEVRQKLADLAARGGDPASRDRWLNAIIAASDAAGDNSTVRMRYLAAQAKLSFGDQRNAEFEAIALRLPFDKSLAEKRKAMEQAVRWYEAAGRYGIAEATTAATYKTAEIQRRLAQDILASERPGGLKALELEQYKILLEEEATGFEENAIKLHEINLERIAGGKPGGIYDEWVKRSMLSLRKLASGRYDRVETVGSYFDYTPPKPVAPAAVPATGQDKPGAASNAKTGA